MSSTAFIVADSDKICAMLSLAAADQGLTVLGSAGDAEGVMSALSQVTVDIILFNSPLGKSVGDRLARELAFLQPQAGFVLLTKAEHSALFAQRLRGRLAFVLAKPVSRQSLEQTVGFMTNALAAVAQERQRGDQLEQKLGDLKIISRAKQLLIGNLHLTEAQAHNHIQKQAMDMRLSPREVAEGILRTYEF